MVTDGKSRFIRASEVGEYVFCARAWRMRQDGYEPQAGQDARDAGERWHLGHGRSVGRILLLRRLSAASLYLAIIVAVLIMLFWWSE